MGLEENLETGKALHASALQLVESNHEMLLALDRLESGFLEAIGNLRTELKSGQETAKLFASQVETLNGGKKPKEPPELSEETERGDGGMFKISGDPPIASERHWKGDIFIGDGRLKFAEPTPQEQRNTVPANDGPVIDAEPEDTAA